MSPIRRPTTSPLVRQRDCEARAGTNPALNVGQCLRLHRLRQRCPSHLDSHYERPQAEPDFVLRSLPRPPRPSTGHDTGQLPGGTMDHPASRRPAYGDRTNCDWPRRCETLRAQINLGLVCKATNTCKTPAMGICFSRGGGPKRYGQK
jgi:hypothetical protein